MSKIIVVGVDGRDPALGAAKKAAILAQAFEGPLHVVTAYGPIETRTITDGVEKYVIDNREEAKSTADEVAAKLVAEFPGLEIYSDAAEGKPADALVDVADELDASIIVVGNKRVQGPARILGSIARSVAAFASCDVYVAHTRPRKG